MFTMRRPLVRSPIGMEVQEAFALFAANFVRWAAAWVRETAQDVPPALTKALGEVKMLVKVVAHSRARVVLSEAGCALVFDAHSAFAGAVVGGRSTRPYCPCLRPTQLRLARSHEAQLHKTYARAHGFIE